MSDFTDHYNVRAIVTMVRLARMRLDAGRSPAPFYRAAGQHLARLRHRKAKEAWGKIVCDECGLGLTRAYELMALATKPDAAIRGRTRKARARTKERLAKSLKAKQNYIDRRLGKLLSMLTREQKSSI